MKYFIYFYYLKSPLTSPSPRSPRLRSPTYYPTPPPTPPHPDPLPPDTLPPPYPLPPLSLPPPVPSPPPAVILITVAGKAYVSPSRMVFGPHMLLSAGKFTFLGCLFTTSRSNAKHMWTQVCQPDDVVLQFVRVTLRQLSQIAVWIPFDSCWRCIIPSTSTEPSTCLDRPASYVRCQHKRKHTRQHIRTMQTVCCILRSSSVADARVHHKVAGTVSCDASPRQYRTSKAVENWWLHSTAGCWRAMQEAHHHPRSASKWA